MSLINVKSVLLVLLLVTMIENKIIVSSPNINFNPCLGLKIKSFYEYGTYPVGEENQYYSQMTWTFLVGMSVAIEFDSKAFMELTNDTATVAAILKLPLENTFIINYFKSSNQLRFTVNGPINGTVPYINSVKIDDVEYCHTPLVGVLDNMVKDNRIARQVKSSLDVHDCGRRKLDYTELIVNGEHSKPGDWPWHAAVYKLKKASNTYICGGTLISKLFVLTAAHCATVDNVPVVPDILNVILGKYQITVDNLSSQQRNVFSVIIHEEFGSPHRLDNDIALLKLMTEAVYNEYVQPACIWSSDINYIPPTDYVLGTVVGWGITQMNDSGLADELKQASMPMIPASTCIKSNPIFYGQFMTDDRKFCAGWVNGTSPCNGDSGGGFTVFVPDSTNSTSQNIGVWYVRGIVSMTIPYPSTRVCDPMKYVIFTDTLYYEIWIRANSHIYNS